MVDWPSRLAREAPFFQGLFEEMGALRVIDAACGTGHHARLFASWGLDVVGADASERMIEEAKALQAAGEEGGAPVRWVLADFLSLPGLVDGPFDVIICIGNSLPHLSSAGEVRQALMGFAGLIRPGGAAVVQIRNVDRMYARGERLLGPSSRVTDGEEHLFVRLYDLEPDRMRLSIVSLARREGRWTAAVDSTQLIPLFSAPLEELVRQAGFREVRRYGGYDKSSYVSLESDDLLLVALTG